MPPKAAEARRRGVSAQSRDDPNTHDPGANLSVSTGHVSGPGPSQTPSGGGGGGGAPVLLPTVPSRRGGGGGGGQPQLHETHSLEEGAVLLKELQSKGPQFIVECVEVSSDRVTSRFLEFVSRTAILRTHDGNKPGNVLHYVSYNPQKQLQLLQYMDTGFLQLLEGDRPHFLVCPTVMENYKLREKFEEVFEIQCGKCPQMMANTRLGLDAMGAVWSFLSKRKRGKNVDDEGGENDDRITDAPPTLSIRAAQLGFSQQGKGGAGLQSNLGFYVNEFVLLFEQHQPLVILHAALDRLSEHISAYEIARRIGQAKPIATCIVSLTDVLTHCHHQPTLVDAICECGMRLVDKLQTAQIAGVCDEHAEVLLSHTVESLRYHAESVKLRRFATMLASVIPGARMAIKLTSIQGDQTNRTVQGNAELVNGLAACCLQCLQSAIPKPSELGVTMEELQSVTSGSKKEIEGVQARERVEQAKLIGKYPQESLPVLWKGAVNTLESCICALDNIVHCCDAEESSIKTVSRRLLRTTALLAKFAVRCLWFAPAHLSAGLLSHGAAALCSFFRRVACWCAMLNEETLWVDSLEGATGLILVKALVVQQEHAKHLHFIHHQWIVKICVGCGAAAERSILAEIHLFYCVMTRWKGVQHKTALIDVWTEVQLVIAAVCATAPSPSHVQTVFQAVDDTVEAYASVAKEFHNTRPRQFLLSLMFASIVDLSSRDFVHQYHIPEAGLYLKQTSHWETYDEFEDDEGFLNEGAKTVRTNLAGISAVELLLMAAPLVYVVDLLRRDLQEGRNRSYGQHCISMAEAMNQSGAPKSISALFITSGISSLRKSSDLEEVERNLALRFTPAVWHSSNIPQAFQLVAGLLSSPLGEDGDTKRAKHVMTPPPTAGSTNATTPTKSGGGVTPVGASRSNTPKYRDAATPGGMSSASATPTPGTPKESALTMRKSFALDSISKSYARGHQPQPQSPSGGGGYSGTEW